MVSDRKWNLLPSGTDAKVSILFKISKISAGALVIYYDRRGRFTCKTNHKKCVSNLF